MIENRKWLSNLTIIIFAIIWILVWWLYQAYLYLNDVKNKEQQKQEIIKTLYTTENNNSNNITWNNILIYKILLDILIYNI